MKKSIQVILLGFETVCIVAALGGFEYMEIKDGQAVSGFGQFFDAAKDLTNFTATWEEKTPRSD